VLAPPLPSLADYFSRTSIVPNAELRAASRHNQRDVIRLLGVREALGPFNNFLQKKWRGEVEVRRGNFQQALAAPVDVAGTATAKTGGIRQRCQETANQTSHQDSNPF